MAVTLETSLGIDLTPREAWEGGPARGEPVVFLEGTGDLDEGWGTLVSLGARRVLCWGRGRGSVGRALESLERLARERRRSGGTSATGLAVLAGFDLRSPREGAREAPPDLLALAVDASVRFPPGQAPVLTLRGDAPLSRAILQRRLDEVRGRGKAEREAPDPAPRRRAVTSLPRDDYLRAVESVKHHIAEGDIYQANLTQRFELPWTGEVRGLYRGLSDAAAAPRSAFISDDGLVVASVSPETFLRVSPQGEVETRPIKGTRPRGASPEEDARLARALVESAKDRAELLMIVDLERNDLGRVCRTGSVRTPQLGELRSYSAVHHLVARVRGDLLPEAGLASLVRATFPGGSVTGAPKRRALEILGALEPVPRSFYTGSLLWLGDDGSLDSSILIRTVILHRGRAWLGAGGGVVADSDPEEEWIESNHKARRLAEVLGFVPEEATSARRAAWSGSTARC